MGDESDDSCSHALLNLNARDFRAKFPRHIPKKPDHNRTISLEGSVGNWNDEVDREEIMSASIEEESVISESQYSGSERGTNSQECLDIEMILGNTGFSPRKLKVQRKVKPKKAFALRNKSNMERGFTDDDEDLRLVKAMAGAKALMIRLKVFVDNSPAVKFTRYSDLIYQELCDFNSVITEEDADIQIVISAARGKVYQFTNQKRILVSPKRRKRKYRFSISCTYTKEIRNRFKFRDDTQLSSRSFHPRSPLRLRATKGMF